MEGGDVAVDGGDGAVEGVDGAVEGGDVAVEGGDGAVTGNMGVSGSRRKGRSSDGNVGRWGGCDYERHLLRYISHTIPRLSGREPRQRGATSRKIHRSC